MAYKYYSFDIFDTCLVRICGNPSSVFFILASAILGKDSDISLKNDFVLIRMNGEKEARKKLINDHKEEVTLEEIYDFCDFSVLTDINNRIIMSKELEIEEMVLLPVDYIKQQIISITKNGRGKVIYVSDMYLPKSFVEKILRKYGFPVNDNLYISSELNKTKNTGSLFKYIIETLSIKSKELRHVGDNKHSDYNIPRKNGIHAEIIRHSYSDYEKMAIESMKTSVKDNPDYTFSLCRAIRLSMPYSPISFLSISFVAPMFVTFVYSILCDAKKRGIKHLYFIARDGYILYLIAKEFASQFTSVKMSYIYASRRALYLPGINGLDVDNIKEIIPYLKDANLEKILYTLQIPEFDTTNYSLNNMNGEQILSILLDDVSFQQQLREKYNEQNELAFKYFKQNGLTEPNSAIVDVLGTRKCQMFINNILNKHGYPNVFGYYFEVTWNRIVGGGQFWSINYQEQIISKSYYHHVSQPLYEQFFAITGQKRTIAYKREKDLVVPEFEDDPVDDKYKKQIFETNINVCLAFAKKYINCSNIDPVIAIQASQHAFYHFCHIPSKQYMKAFGDFYCTDSGSSREKLIYKRSLFSTILNRNQSFRWPEGNVIYNSGLLYPFVRFFLGIKLKLRHIRK